MFSAGPLGGWAGFWTLLGVFAGGLALNLTPCVYPLIPITVSYFSGRREQGRGRLAVHCGLYLAGLALTNSLLGLAAALTGGLLGALLQHPAVLIGVALVLVFFAVSLFGLWELKLPASLTAAASKSYSGYFGTFFMGLTLGVVAAPCLGPFVLGLLTWMAGLGNPAAGFLIFFILSLGLGLPLTFLAVFSGSLNKLPRAGQWMVRVRTIMGWVLVLMAAYFVRPLLPEAARALVPAVLFGAAGLHLLGSGSDSQGRSRFDHLSTFLGLAALAAGTWLVAGWIFMGPGVAWRAYSESLTAEAAAEGKPVILDFYAAWCTPCRRLDEVTFHDAGVVRVAEADFIMIKIDLTQKENEAHQRLLEKYAVKGVPTVIFLGPDGLEIKELRAVDYLPPEKFLPLMKAAQGGRN